MKTKTQSRNALILLIAACLASSLLAQTQQQQKTTVTPQMVSPDVPRVLDYQGILTNPNGESYNGTFNITFTIINTKNDSVLFTETVQDLQVSDGLVHHLIGSVAGDLDPFIFQNSTALRIKVNDETLSPDVVIAPAPVALVALYADSLKGPLPQTSFSGKLSVSSTDTAIVAYSTTGPAIHAVSGGTGGMMSSSKRGSVHARINPVEEKNVGIYSYGYRYGVQGTNYHESETGAGVEGFGTKSTGVRGWSWYGTGVEGDCSDGIGVHGKSTNGEAGHFDGKVAIFGDLDIHGGKLYMAGGKVKIDTDGEIYAKSFHTSSDGGTTNTSGVNTDGEANFKSVSSTEGITSPRDGGGNVYYDGYALSYLNSAWGTVASWNANNGNLYTIGTKSAAVSTMSYGKRKFYTDESTEVTFFDRGQGQLENGEVTIQLDPVFLETVTIDDDHPILVQVTLTSDCKGVFIAEKTPTSFTVRELMGGISDATFDWEVAAKRKGYESVRLEELNPFDSTGRR